MFKRIQDSVFIGLAAGIAIPGALVSIVWYLMHKFSFLSKADLLLIACIAVNLLLLKHAFSLNKERLGRGIISATFIWAFLFFFYKINQ